jgi:hypothetical protein
MYCTHCGVHLQYVYCTYIQYMLYCPTRVDSKKKRSRTYDYGTTVVPLMRVTVQNVERLYSCMKITIEYAVESTDHSINCIFIQTERGYFTLL